MMGGNVPSTRSLENATISPLVLKALMENMGSRSILQSTQTWCGGPDTTTMRAGRYSRASNTRFLRQSFASGVVLVFRSLKILG